MVVVWWAALVDDPTAAGGFDMSPLGDFLVSHSQLQDFVYYQRLQSSTAWAYLFGFRKSLRRTVAGSDTF